MRDEEKTKRQLISELAALRQRVEELESEAGFRTLVEKMPDAIFYIHALDEPNALVYVSPQVENMFGCAVQELQRSAGLWLNHVHPDDRERVKSEFKRCKQSEEQFIAEYRMIKADGGVAWMHDVADMLRDETGRLHSILGVAFDISSQKHAEEALQASEARYRNIFENATEGIFQTTPEGRYLSMNPAFARMFGYSSPEEMMTAISDIREQVYVHPEDRDRIKSLLKEKGRAERVETQVYRRDGQMFWISSNARVVRDLDGAILYFEGTVEDITERKRVQEELEAKSFDLEEINTVLRVLLKRREADQKEFSASVLSNLRELAFPYLEKLRDSGLNELQKTHLRILESHLAEIGAPFLRSLSHEFANLSPTERQIASLIKGGRRTKEIAEIMGVSVNTILTHRYHLRSKLGVKNKNINLTSFLGSISTL